MLFLCIVPRETPQQGITVEDIYFFGWTQSDNTRTTIPRCNTIHGHLYTGQLSRHFFLTSDQPGGYYLGPKLHPRDGFFGPQFFLILKSQIHEFRWLGYIQRFFIRMQNFLSNALTETFKRNIKLYHKVSVNFIQPSSKIGSSIECNAFQ